MTSPAADSPALDHGPRDGPEPSGPPAAGHPEPAFREAQEWIEAVTGRSFGDKGFRSGLENGILLCELLSAIKPGVVKKINRLPTPIAGLDNLTVFLRGCEELGLKGSQLFDPGDLQDTSVRANLKDADCNRKLKNVLNTVFWLGKAANSCTSYSGPTLNLKEFEELLAHMRMECEVGGDSGAQTVRDSGYDCWDSERSESLSPPRHTRDNSLDSLDSFGSHSQHSPSPDVVNRLNSDGRGSDSEADGKKPDVRRDDMLARRTASSESRAPVPFNQFLPNRTNATAYVPAPRRKPHGEEGEQRSQHSTTLEEGEISGPRSKTFKTVTWAPGDSVKEVEEEPTQEDQDRILEDRDRTREDRDVSQEVLEQKRLQRLQKAGIKVLPAAVRYSRAQEPSEDRQEDKGPSPDIILRRDNDFLTNHKATWDSSSSDGEGDEDARKKVPDVRKDDLASRRAARVAAAPRVHQFLPAPVCSSRDRERWEGIRRASQQALQEKEASERTAAVSDIITRKDNPFLNSKPHAQEEEDEEEQGGMGGDKVVPNKMKDDLARRRALAKPRPLREGPMSFVSASMSQADMQKWERLRMAEPSQVNGSDPAQSPTPTTSDLTLWTPDAPPTVAELDARFDQYVKAAQEEEEAEDDDEEERIPNLQKDDMLARRTGAFNKRAAAHNHFLPLPASKRCTQQEVVTDAAPRRKMAVQAEWERRSNPRGFPAREEPQESSRVPVETPPQRAPDRAIVRQSAHSDDEDEEEEEGGVLPDPEKDDMMARRTRAFHKPTAAGKKVPRRSLSRMAAESVEDQIIPPLKAPSRQCTGAREEEEEEEQDKEEEKKKKERRQGGCKTLPNISAPLPRGPAAPPASPPAGAPQSVEPQGSRQSSEGEEVVVVERKVLETRSNGGEPRKPQWMEDDDLPPMMSMSMSDMPLEEEEDMGHMPPLNQSRFERMHEQLINFEEEDDGWQDHLARWKNRRRSASQELIKKEEERKRIEKRMKEDGADSSKRKSTKTYKEIVEEKERREIDLCEAYRRAQTPEEAAIVLQRYALRFTISDATLDSLKLPRSTSPNTTAAPVDWDQRDPEHRPTQPTALPSDTSEPRHWPEPTEATEQSPKPRETKEENQVLRVKSSPTSPEAQPAQTKKTQPVHPVREDRESAQTVRIHHVSPTPYPPSKPVPLLTAKPYCLPGNSHGARKSVLLDGLVRVNGDMKEEVKWASTPASSSSLLSPEEKTEDPASSSPLLSPEENPASSFSPPKSPKKETEDPASSFSPPQSQKKEKEEPASEQTAAPVQTTDPDQPTTDPDQPTTESRTSHSGSAMSALIGGRSCIITTTIVTELTQTLVEPITVDTAGDGPTPMLNLAKRVNHWVWDPNEERSRQERWQREQERLLQEQYQKEQEKLKGEWERAQKEVEEEERRHNEEERRILDETATPLNPSGLAKQLPGPGEQSSAPAQPNHQTQGRDAPAEPHSQRSTNTNGEQHKSKLHFFQGESKVYDVYLQIHPTLAMRPRNRKCGRRLPWTATPSSFSPTLSRGIVLVGTQQPPSSSSHPPSPSRCVSGKRLCSGCTQPLGKGAAMIIDTMGLFFHLQCFKCGVCSGQLGDTSTGTDVRIRNGHLTCNECYIASRGGGQPTTL
ncbi:unnamed protein product [Merluccius merluccius]